MALIRNGSHQLSGINRMFGAVGASGLRSVFACGGVARNFDSGEHAVSGVTNKAAIPSGARHPLAWKMGTKAGSMASANDISMGLSPSASGALGVNGVAAIPMAIDFSQAAMGLVTSGVASVTFSITVPAPGMVGAVGGSANVSGINFTVSPTLGAKSGLAVSMPMTITVQPSIQAKGSIAATITNEGAAVTPTSVAAEVWGTVAASFNVAGTMGNKMNSAASAGDPWGTLIPASYGAGTAGQILGTLQNDINLHTDTAIAGVNEEVNRLSFDNAVHIDAVDGSPGTAFPLGILAHPVDNMFDALAIAYANGFGRIEIKNALTLLASDVLDNYTLSSDSWPAVTINTGVNMENTIFERVSLYGEFEGFWNILNDCWVYNITNFSGWVRGGSIGQVALSVGLGVEFGGQVFFDNIVPLFPGVPSEITANTNSEISMTNCTDLVLLKSMTTGCKAYIGLSGGTITIDSSCTGGTIVVSGVGTLVNNSAVDVDSTGLAASWTEVIESGFTAGEVLKLIAAATQGNATGLENGSPVFKGLDGTTERITATYSNGTRNVTGRNAA